MISYIFIALAATFALYRLILVNDLWSRLLSAIMIVAIAQIFFPIEAYQTAGFVLYACTVAGVLIYAIARPELGQKKRLLLLIITVPLLIVHVFRLSHWPHVGILSLGLLIPIIACLALLKDYKKNRFELGFLVILAVDAAIQFRIVAQSMLSAA